MENSETIYDPEKARLESLEQEYQESNKAVEELYKLSLIKDTSAEKDRINSLFAIVDIYNSTYMSKLLDVSHSPDYSESTYKLKDTFFETLPIINKMGKIYSNINKVDWNPGFCDIRSGGKYGGCSGLESNAHYLLCLSLGGLDRETLIQLDSKKTRDILDSLSILIEHGSGDSLEKSLNFFNLHHDHFSQLGEHDVEISDKLTDMHEFIESNNFERRVINIVDENIVSAKHPMENFRIRHCESLLHRILEKYGFDPKKILDEWCESNYQYGRKPNVAGNLEKIIEIEEKRKGASQFLYKNFGIRNFYRYPESVLIAQFDEYNNTEKPYGILLQATGDHNGSFGTKAEKWEKLFEEIKDKYNFRIVEATCSSS
jgi:hypothetical protein